MNVGLGRPRYSAMAESIMLQLNELTPNSALYSPGGFKVVVGFALYSVSRDKNSSGVPQYVSVTHPSGAIIQFLFADGESVGMPQETLDDCGDDRLAMVDAEGWATASDPTFYDYYPGDGSRWRFGAAHVAHDYMQLVEHRTPQGRVETAQDIGLEVVRDADGVLRQVKSAAWFADFVVTGVDAYDLSVYPNDASCVPGTRTSEGYYAVAEGAVPDVVWEFRNPNPGTPKDLQITKKTGTVSETWLYTYQEAVRDFTLIYPQGVKTDRLERYYSDDEKSLTIRRSVTGADGLVARSEEKNYMNDVGGSLLVSTVRDPGGLNLTTAYSYYSGGVLDRLEKMTVYENDDWVRFEYDASRRVTAEVRPWLDSPTNAPNEQCAVTRYGYGLFAAGDFLAYGDQRPRTVVNEVCGVEVSRTYHAYPTNALGQAQEIEERAAFQGAPYGHASNPRTVKTYYAANAASPLPGRLATVAYPGGKTETCGYEYGAFNASTSAFTPDPDGGAWRETVTTSYGANSGVQSLRSARVWDEKGREVLNESYVEDGASFAPVGWTRMSYDRTGKLIETAYSDGRVVSATWANNCCGKESETSAEGIITGYGYNLFKQKISETQKGLDADGSGDITTLYTYDLENRVLSAAVTNVASGLGYVASLSAYDAVGHVTNTIDRLGNSTTYSYSGTGDRQVAPNGVTNLTERYLDGRARRALENGIVRQSYAYGVVSPGGLRWTLSAQGALPDVAPLATVADLRALVGGLDFPWAFTVTDPLGRTVFQGKPGFGGSALVTSNAYDIAGNLLCSVKYAVFGGSANPAILSENLYAYAADGSLYLSALDLNTNGVIDLEGPDRITGTSAGYEKDASNLWWRVSWSWVYPAFNSLAAVTTSVQRTQLTGLGAARGDGGVRISHSETLDVRGNATVSEALVDRTARKTTHITALPTSVQPEIQITVNGLLRQTVSSTAVTNTFGYDALARQTASTDGRGNTTVTAFNPQGMVFYTEDAASNRTSYAYDALGRRTEATDALGNVTHTRYDAEGRVAKTWGATYPVEYGYDTQGRMVSMKTFRDENGPGDETRWLYENPTGLLTNKLYAEGIGPSYTYTADGKQASRLWARGILTTYAYDMEGSLLGVDYSDTTPDVAYTYDRLGNTISVADASGIRTFTNDTEGQTLADAIQFQNEVFTLHEAYDTFGRNAGYALSNTVDGVASFVTGMAQNYDVLGRISEVTIAGLPSPFRYGWLAGSELQHSLVMPNGVTRQTTYDPHRHLLTSITHTNAAGLVLTQRTFAYDAAGRLSNRAQYRLGDETNRVDAFGYNPRSELTSAALGTNVYAYAFDPIGNRQTAIEPEFSATYAANTLNQYTNISYGQSSVFVPVSDLDGNQTLIKTSTGIWRVIYNAENRPIVFSNDTTVVEMAYDYQGRRFDYKETVNGVITCHELYLYIGNLQIAALNILNGINEIHAIAWDPTGLKVTRPLALQHGREWLFYGFDQVKNVTELFDMTGTIAAAYNYAPFGTAISATGSTAVASNPITFSSEVSDLKLGLNYYNFRHLNPMDGRWIERDPVWEEGGLNLFSFVANQPVNLHDMNGKQYGISYIYTPNVPLGGNGILGLTTVDAPYIWTAPNTACKNGLVGAFWENRGEITVQYFIQKKDPSWDYVVAHEGTHVQNGLILGFKVDGYLMHGECLCPDCFNATANYYKAMHKVAVTEKAFADVMFDSAAYGSDLGLLLQSLMQQILVQQKSAAMAAVRMQGACGKK